MIHDENVKSSIWHVRRTRWWIIYRHWRSVIFWNLFNLWILWILLWILWILLWILVQASKLKHVPVICLNIFDLYHLSMMLTTLFTYTIPCSDSTQSSTEKFRNFWYWKYNFPCALSIPDFYSRLWNPDDNLLASKCHVRISICWKNY